VRPAPEPCVDRNGRLRSRLPVTGATALATAGAAGETQARHRRGLAAEGTMWTSIAGISFMPLLRAIVGNRMDDAAVLQRDLAVQRGGEPEAGAAFHLRSHDAGNDGAAEIDGARRADRTSARARRN
jgi:hypothetical protein